MSPATKAILVLPAALLGAALILIGSQLLFGTMSQSLSAWSPAAQESAFVLLCFGLLAMVALAGMAVFGIGIGVGARPLADAPAGLAMGVAGLGLAVLLSAIAGTTAAGDQPGGGALLMLGLVVAIVQTGAEELYFRGWMQPALQAGWGRWRGLLATATAFSAVHFIGGDFDPVSMLNLFLGGLWFGLLADRSGGLLLPIGAHFGWNAAEELLFGVTPNPGTGSFGAFVDWNLAGSALWGGSEAGLNASLSASFVLLALVVATLGWSGRASPIGLRG